MSAIRNNFNSSEALPLIPEEVTKEWLSKALGREVAEATTKAVIHGTASKILIDVEFRDDSQPQKLPVCVKGGFYPELVAHHPLMFPTYRREAEFYYHIGPKAPGLRLPRAWYCGSNVDPGQGIAIMDDLAAQGCTFGNFLETWPVDRVYSGIEQLASLHGSTWGATGEDYPWLSAESALGENPLRGMMLSLLTPAAWDARPINPATNGGREGTPAVPEGLEDPEKVAEAFQALWKSTSSGSSKYSCVVHGDAHVGNTFVTAQGQAGFIDWQALHLGSPFHDVAYFVSGALSPEDRRAHERDLVRHYLATLARRGGPDLTREEKEGEEKAWTEYRKHLFHGYAWALTAPQMQPFEVIKTMTERHCAAIVDHGVLELLKEEAAKCAA